ncbi:MULTISPECIES: phage tail protein [Enterobacter]|uniref:phage tail fiber protein n=1 Tax=Enterobacter TaxID=547 RepID=UPI000C776D18|nr:MULTISPECIES: phage tail protein [Enterobacter cloacae complex]MCE1601220.1 phage tail protein [Enterobacter hormaechei]MCM8227291.1 phage tail protein [Enterobacter hormaechei]MDC9828209.1 phage tail protein [Enterobacter hormaechei subsp. steigerwaltii]MDF3670319.1 phage tail protein [Enterobacter hormaechei]PLP51078.1 phage tail protein [Enterobacter cloacae complex sp. TREC1]
MLYNTGTIAINGNTATGTGTNWTAPASQIRVGQTLFVLSNPVQMFQITAINSATSLTVTPAASPALSGQKYGILVTDSLSVDGLAQSMSQLINEYDENIGAWETFATTSANQSITVTINGTRVTIPAIGKLVQKASNGAVGVSDGGTGATKAEDARTNLGLGSSATRNSLDSEIVTNSDTSQIPTLKALGLGYSRHIDNFSNTNMLGFGRFTSQTVNNPANTHGVGVQLQYDAGPSTSWFVWTIDGQAYIQTSHVQGTTYLWKKVYTTANTTVASDGSIKAASPVARIVTSRDVCQRADIAEDGFAWCGCGTSNAEAEGINISRLDVGVYVLTGSTGLASDGWQLLPPMDPGGMGELGVVEAEQTDNGELTIRLFKRKYMLNDEGEIVKTKGAAMDVPSNSWIDVRLDMPENSVWNQRQKAAMEAADNESGS